MGPSGSVTDPHTHEITQNSGALPALQRDPLQCKKSKEGDGRTSPAPAPTLTLAIMHHVPELFYFLATGDVHLHSASSSSSLGQAQRLQEQNVRPRALQGHLQPPTNPSLLLFQALSGEKSTV